MFSWDFRKAKIVHLKWTLQLLSGKIQLLQVLWAPAGKPTVPGLAAALAGKSLFLAEELGILVLERLQYLAQMAQVWWDCQNLWAACAGYRGWSTARANPSCLLTRWTCPHTATLDSHQLDSEWKFEYWPEWLTSSFSSCHTAMGDETKPRQGQDVCACSLWQQELDQNKSPVSASWQLTWILRWDEECVWRSRPCPNWILWVHKRLYSKTHFINQM